MSIIDTVSTLASPHLLLIKLAAVGVVLAGVVGVTWHARGVVADRDIAELHAARDKATAAASEAARAIERTRVANLEGIAREADTRTQIARRDAVAAADVSRRLREHIARLAGAATNDSPAAEPGAPAAGPGLLLADLFGRADARAGDLAAWADTAYNAGLACERAYDSLNAKGVIP
jgi:hypothetical protein